MSFLEKQPEDYEPIRWTFRRIVSYSVAMGSVTFAVRLIIDRLS